MNLVTSLSEHTDISLSVLSFGEASARRYKGRTEIILLKKTIADYLIPIIPLIRLASHVRRIRPDIVHVQGVNLSPYLICALFLLKKPKKVVTLHSYPTVELIAHNRLRKNSPRHMLLKWLEEKSIRTCDAIISVDSRLREWAESKLDTAGREKISVILNGVDLHLFDNRRNGDSVRRDLCIPKEDFVIFHAKQFVVKNGQRFLIESIPEISQSVPNVKLILAGDGPLRDTLEGLVRDMEMSDRVLFVGDIPNDAVADYLAASDVVIVPSIHVGGLEEASSIFLVEAMSMSKPVIASNIGGLKETITADVDGILVPDGDSNAIAKNVIRLYQNRSLAKKLGSNARSYVEEKRSWRKGAGDTAAVYEWCLNTARK